MSKRNTKEPLIHKLIQDALIVGTHGAPTKIKINNPWFADQLAELTELEGKYKKPSAFTRLGFWADKRVLISQWFKWAEQLPAKERYSELTKVWAAQDIIETPAIACIYDENMSYEDKLAWLKHEEENAKDDKTIGKIRKAVEKFKRDENTERSIDSINLNLQLMDLMSQMKEQMKIVDQKTAIGTLGSILEASRDAEDLEVFNLLMCAVSKEAVKVAKVSAKYAEENVCEVLEKIERKNKASHARHESMNFKSAAQKPGRGRYAQSGSEDDLLGQIAELENLLLDRDMTITRLQTTLSSISSIARLAQK